MRRLHLETQVMSQNKTGMSFRYILIKSVCLMTILNKIDLSRSHVLNFK
jgi:hypothetical protein